MPLFFRQLCNSRFLFQRLFGTTTTRLCISNEAKENLDRMVHKSKVVVFMKGVPEAPRCGFSNAVAQILRMHGVTFDSYDVLESEELRQGVKEYSNWPTIPQIYIDGEFVGGCDILLKMHQNGELIKELEKVGIASALLKAASEPKDT